MKTIKIKHVDDIPQNYTGIVVCFDGTKEWWLNGKLHREDGPAVVFPNEVKHWYLNGKLHREDGPAVVWPNGTKHWWLNGKKIDSQVVELYYMLKYKKLWNYDEND